LGYAQFKIDRKKREIMTYEQWLKLGYDKGWVGPPVCQTHDGTPMSEAESDAFEEDDPCIHILRLYEDADHKSAVESEHSPSSWRASSLGDA
jgi:hypothetical protein